MNIFSICGIALLSVAAIQIVGKDNRSFGTFIGIAGSLCLLFPAFLELHSSMNLLKELLSNYRFEGDDLLLRALGIGLTTEFTGEICRDSGETHLGNTLDFASKVLILGLCVPLWKQLFELLGGLIP